MVEKSYLDELNDAQRRAVEYLDGPALVIAGAGSGKTRVLTYKVVHLLNQGYEPWRILALTFTNKAAREMRQRIEALTGVKTASKIWMGTFHSIFFRILRTNAERIGFKSDFTIYDTADSKSLIKTIIRDMQLDDKVYKPNVVQSIISTAKNALISPDDYAADRELMEADRHSRRPLMQHIYATYMRRCHLAGAMDFDDLLFYTNILLRDNPDVAAHYREFFRYVLVDEYQDTNFAQHLIVSKLCADEAHFCVVGDDAQSIYSFRGANIRNILGLKNSYPSLVTFKLEQNYRSTQTIINAANTLIAKNKHQIPKNVFSERSVGDRIELARCYSDYEESFIVANRIARRKVETGDSYDDFAILYRTNAQSRILEESLRKRNIPYRIYGGLSFYQRKEIKDVIAYMRMSVNPDDDEALRRIINFPARGIGETTLNKLIRAAIDGGRSIWQIINDPEAPIDINSGTRKKLNAFAALISKFIDLNLSGAHADILAENIIRDTRMLADLITDHTPENISRQENIEELLNGVREFVAQQQEEEGLEANLGISDYLQRISLLTDQDEQQGDEPRVTLMTVHAAKGLEFSNVFIVGLEDDLFPSAMSKNSPAEIEEERRLLYVAMTRAKNFCMMTYASSRYRNGETQSTRMSPFIRDIDQRYLLATSGSIETDSARSTPQARGWQSHALNGESRSIFGSSRQDSRRSAEHPLMRPTSPSVPKPSTSSQPSSGKFSLHSPSELREGMTIEHERFGRGTIDILDTSSSNAKIVVRFDSLDTKTLLLKFARFNII